MIPPQVSSTSRKPLSIAFEEIADDKIVRTDAPEEPEVDALDLPAGDLDVVADDEGAAESGDAD